MKISDEQLHKHQKNILFNYFEKLVLKLYIQYHKYIYIYIYININTTIFLKLNTSMHMTVDVSKIYFAQITIFKIYCIEIKKEREV